MHCSAEGNGGLCTAEGYRCYKPGESLWPVSSHGRGFIPKLTSTSDRVLDGKKVRALAGAAIWDESWWPYEFTKESTQMATGHTWP